MPGCADTQHGLSLRELEGGLLGRHSVHAGFLQAAPNFSRHGNRAVRTEQLDHIFDQRTVVRDDVSFGDARHGNAISVSRRAIFAGSWHGSF